MSFIVAIETSSSDYFIAFGEGGETIYNSAHIEGLNKDKDLGLLLRTGLEKTGKKTNEIEIISVNIGPGGLGAVRSGIALANGLSFGLGKPLLPLNAFELTGFEVAKNTSMPILITTNAADGNAYGGLFTQGKLLKMEYGPLEQVARGLTKNFSKCCLAGTHQDKLPSILDNIECAESGVKFAHVQTQIEFIISHEIEERQTKEPVAPLNELSEIFQATGETS